MVAIKTSGLTKCYGSTVALNGLDLQVKKGSIFGLLGPNGAGKTTTINLILGFRTPTAGKVEVLGDTIASDLEKILPKIGYVSENSNLYGYMKVREIIQFTSALRRDSWDNELVERCLEIFPLPLEEKVSTLSQGMRRQLALILALAPRPELVILDEPTAGLDPVKKRQFFSLLMEEIAETNRTAFVSTHNLPDLERIADTIGILNNGRLVLVDKVGDIKRKYRKVVVAWEHEQLPSELGKKDFVVAKQHGTVWNLVVDDDRVMVQLEVSNPKMMQVHQMSLEEVFILHTSEEGKRGSE